MLIEAILIFPSTADPRTPFITLHIVLGAAVVRDAATALSHLQLLLHDCPPHPSHARGCSLCSDWLHPTALRTRNRQRERCQSRCNRREFRVCACCSDICARCACAQS